MWTIAAVNKKFNGPLGSYNGLTDVHLAHYFSRPSRRSHLKAAKLITEDGFIIPEKNVKVELYLDEKKRKVYDILAKSILQNAIHKEGSWNKKLCNYLEDISKMSAVDKARKTFKKKSGKVASELHIEQFSSPNQNFSFENCTSRSSKHGNNHRKHFNPSFSAPAACLSLSNHGLHKVANLKRCLSAKQHSPYVVPLLLCGSYKDHPTSLLDSGKSSKLKKRNTRNCNNSAGHSKTSVKKNMPDYTNMASPIPHHKLKFGQCKMTILYHGHVLLTNFQKSLTQNIIVKQQHCGGTPVVIYKGNISANETFSFLILDHEGYFFSIIIFLNGIRDLKLSSCCAFRYLPGRRLGGPNGTFSIKSIEGGKPCLNCQYQEFERKNFKSISQASEIAVDNSANKENSVVNLDISEDKTHDKLSNDVPQISDETQGGPEAVVLNTSDVESLKSNDDTGSADEEIQEILDDFHNLSAKGDSSSGDAVVDEDAIVDETNEISFEEEVKDFNGSSHSSSPTNISEISEKYIEPKNYKEISVDSSSDEEEGNNQHVVTVSVHGSPTGRS